jgi:hypothetical protein
MRGLAIALLGVLVSAVGNAAVISVNNASFETFNPLNQTGCGANCAFNVASIPGWVNGGTSGSFRPGNPANTTYFDSIPDGEIIAYSNDSTITQTVAATVQAGLLYTLMVDVGNRKEQNFTGSVELLIGSTVIAATGVAAPEGAFSTYTALYTGLLADVGKSITIRLSSAGAQGNFDNVRLSDSTGSLVPEPATIGLMGLAVGLLAFSRKRLG